MKPRICFAKCAMYGLHTACSGWLGAWEALRDIPQAVQRLAASTINTITSPLVINIWVLLD